MESSEKTKENPTKRLVKHIGNFNRNQIWVDLSMGKYDMPPGGWGGLGSDLGTPCCCSTDAYDGS
jgi:hypothetical protein